MDMKYIILIIGSILVTTEAASISNRIVGGVEAKIEEVPYQVSFHAPDFFCGGSIISSKWILSAAHCFGDETPSNLTARVGSSTRSSGGKVIPVSRVVNHQLFSTSTIDYDYALIELQDELEMSDSVKTISLPKKSDEIKSGVECLVSGWGDTQNPNESAEVLRKVVVPIVEQTKCEKIHASFNKITPRMICAGFDQGGRDPCIRDSGGPLACNGTLFGVISWGQKCGSPNLPGVYSKVAAIRDWITKVTGI